MCDKPNRGNIHLLPKFAEFADAGVWTADTAERGLLMSDAHNEWFARSLVFMLGRPGVTATYAVLSHAIIESALHAHSSVNSP